MSVELSPELKNALVNKAETIAGLAASQKDQAAQLRNLLQIAQRESEVAVLQNFVRYQRGRRATRDFWTPIEEPVNAYLKEIETKWAPDDPELRKAAIIHFFGYMVRQYVYLTQAAKVSQTSAGKGERGTSQRSRNER